MKLTKNTYLLSFIVVVLILACVRWVFPAVAEPKPNEVLSSVDDSYVSNDLKSSETLRQSDLFANSIPHKIFSVPSYDVAFPDTQAVQLVAAKRWGVTPVKNRRDAEERKRELVYVGANPYYHIDPLYSSIPYLVPRAAVLLEDIGRAFFDSLYVKGVPLHQIIVTSILRSQDDVAKLRRRNGNATENSCHLYGTTFDISYVRYNTVEPPEGPARRPVRDDSLKFVLCEVLRDMREQGRCFIKYERKQSCFHMTVR